MALIPRQQIQKKLVKRNCTFKYWLLTGLGQLQLYLSYLSLDFQLLSGSSYLFLARIVVVLASEFESYDAPLFRLSLIENECTCQGHAAFGLSHFFLIIWGVTVHSHLLSQCGSSVSKLNFNLFGFAKAACDSSTRLPQVRVYLTLGSRLHWALAIELWL